MSTQTATTGTVVTLTDVKYHHVETQWSPKLFVAVAGRALWATAETRQECERLVREKYWRLQPGDYRIVEVVASIPFVESGLPDPVWPPKKTFAEELIDLKPDRKKF